MLKHAYAGDNVAFRKNRALQPFALNKSNPAWDFDTKRTNYQLAEGNRVELKVDAKGQFSDGYFFVPKGAKDVVATAGCVRRLM